MHLTQRERQERRVRRVRGRIHGSSEQPRLAVFRSNKHVSAQIINDETGATLVQISEGKKQSGTKTERAAALGALLAAKAQKHGIKKVVFDRRQYRYHGRIAAFAQAARDAGLEF